jgi:putative hydrolase of the HAD superfamily
MRFGPKIRSFASLSVWFAISQNPDPQFFRAERGKETPMSPFDVILFDVGGVLLTNGWDHKERRAAVEHFHLDLQELETRHTQVDAAWERGEISIDQYLDAAVFYEPRSFTREEFVDFMLEQSQLLQDGAMRVLKEISASNGCMVGALNNEARETNEFRFGKFGLRQYFKVALSSCYVGLRKPELAMYRRALDILGSPPQRVLFIDDREENVAGAVAAGIKAIRFTGEAALWEELDRLGVV